MRGNMPTGSYGAPHPDSKGGWFGRFASVTAQVTGKPATFLLATLIVIVWGITGNGTDHGQQLRMARSIALDPLGD